MLTGAHIENYTPSLSDRFHSCSELIQRVFPTARWRVIRGESVQHSSDRANTPGERVRPGEYPSLPPRSFEWLSLEELTAEAMQSGILTSHEWDGKRHTMTVLGERYSFTPKQARAFLFGAIEGQRIRAHYAEMELR